MRVHIAAVNNTTCASSTNCISLALFTPEILFPIIIFAMFYCLNIWDAQYFEFKLKAQKAEIEFARKMGILKVIILLFCLSTHNIRADDNIYQAIQKDDPTTVSHLLENDRSLATLVGMNGITPLHLAVAKDNPVIAGILIAAGADIGAKTTEGFTPLHWAASRDAVQCLRMLIRLGANINETSNHGITPLHWAALKNATNAVKFLIAAGAKLDIPTDNGMLPRHWAVKAGASEAAEILIFKEVSDSGSNELSFEEYESSSTAYETSPPVISSSPPSSVPPATTNLPIRRAVPGEALLVPLGFGHEISFVWIPSLRIWFGKYEVTNGQYRRFKPEHNSMNRESYSLNDDNQPAVYVSWNDAMNYCKWLNTNYSNRIPQNCVFRLPTSKEWQHVAACGTNRKYPWGEKLPPKYGNYSDLAARKALAKWSGIRHYDDGYIVTCPVSESGVNEWGIYGMGGNVWEWCMDWFDDAHHYKIRHGASWDFDTEIFLPISTTGFDRPNARYDNIGFRVVISGPPLNQ